MNDLDYMISCLKAQGTLAVEMNDLHLWHGSFSCNGLLGLSSFNNTDKQECVSKLFSQLKTHLLLGIEIIEKNKDGWYKI